MRRCISIAILAGGEGQRLGGIFKPLLNICNEPMIKRIIKNIEGIEYEILISVRNSEQINLLKNVIEYDVRYIVDRGTYMNGILRALYSIAQEANCNTIAILPCDTPFIRKETIVNLLKSHRDECNVSIPIWPNGYIEPIVGIYSRDSLLRVLEYISRDNIIAVRDLYKYMYSVCYIDIYSISINPDKEFLNINTNDDIAKAQTLCQDFSL